MSDKIVQFLGATPAGVPADDMDHVLREAAGKIVKGLVIGYTKDCELYVAANSDHAAMLCLLLEEAKLELFKASGILP